jgi:hypothetical protein
MLQHTISDVGFTEFMVVPMRRDNSFLYHKANMEEMSVFNEEAVFLVIFFIIVVKKINVVEDF